MKMEDYLGCGDGLNRSSPLSPHESEFKVFIGCVNDPSAGSPTETLLRLLLLLSDKVYITSRT